MKFTNVWNGEQLNEQKERVKNILACVASLTQGKDVTFEGVQYAPASENLALFQNKAKGAVDLYNKQAKLYKMYKVACSGEIKNWFESPYCSALSVNKDGELKTAESYLSLLSLLKAGKDNGRPFPHMQEMQAAFKVLHESLVLAVRPSSKETISKNAIKKALTAFFVSSGLFNEGRECKSIDAHYALSSVSGATRESCTLKDVNAKQVENILISVYRAHMYSEKYMFASTKKELAMLERIIKEAQDRKAELTK